MPYSQFTKARLVGSAAHVSGPFVFHDDELPMTVAGLSFVLIQGDQLVHGSGGAEGDKWDGKAAPASNLVKWQPLQAFGTALLVTQGPPPRFQTFSWSDTVTLE